MYCKKVWNSHHPSQLHRRNNNRKNSTLTVEKHPSHFSWGASLFVQIYFLGLSKLA